MKYLGLDSLNPSSNHLSVEQISQNLPPSSWLFHWTGLVHILNIPATLSHLGSVMPPSELTRVGYNHRVVWAHVLYNQMLSQLEIFLERSIQNKWEQVRFEEEYKEFVLSDFNEKLDTFNLLSRQFLTAWLKGADIADVEHAIDALCAHIKRIIAGSVALFINKLNDVNEKRLYVHWLEVNEGEGTPFLNDALFLEHLELVIQLTHQQGYKFSELWAIFNKNILPLIWSDLHGSSGSDSPAAF